MAVLPHFARNRQALIACAMFVLLAPVLSGCWGGSSSKVKRVAVSGAVAQGSTPLPEATISFLPAEGSSTASAITGVRDGRYAFNRENGPPAGKYQVLIQLPTPKRNRKQDADTGIRDPKKSAAGKTSWQFDVEVPAGSSFKKDFTLD